MKKLFRSAIARELSVLATACVLSFGIAGEAAAVLFTEMGDAGQLMGTATDVGAGVDQITGDNSADDIDVYKLSLGAGLFEAEVTAQGDDMALVLFDGLGFGLRADDDSGACLFCPEVSETLAAGMYFLGVFPVFSYESPTSAGGNIWAFVLGDVNSTPDGPGAGDPWTGWAPFFPGGGGTYTIQLNQTTVGAVPEPSSLALLGMALGGFGLARRRGGR